jgi:hypothetical protein
MITSERLGEQAAFYFGLNKRELYELVFAAVFSLSRNFADIPHAAQKSAEDLLKAQAEAESKRISARST